MFITLYCNNKHNRHLIAILMLTNIKVMAKQKRVKFVMEFQLETTLPELFESMSTEYGLEKWFANKVFLDDQDVYTFEWDEITVHAKIVGQKKNDYIRFSILENSADEFFELKILENEITEDISLEITDFASADEVDDYKMLWVKQAKYLKNLIEEIHLV